MKRLILATLLFSSAIFANEANNTMAIKQEGIKYIKMLGMALKSEVKKHMQADKSGVEALTFCVDKAAKITAEVNSKLPENVRVRRTALKLRNPANKADETDTKVMQEYVAKIKEGKFSPKDITVVEVNNTYRVYKPLVTGKVCLKCHGENIDPKLSEVIKKYYPHDEATGFKKGDLRGVIVAEIKK